VLVLYPLLACLVEPPEYVYRAFTWGEADMYDYLKLPGRSLESGGNSFHFGENLQEARVRAANENLSFPRPTQTGTGPHRNH